MFWKVGADSVAPWPLVRTFWSLQAPVPGEKVGNGVVKLEAKPRAVESLSGHESAAWDAALPNCWRSPVLCKTPVASASVSGDAPVPVLGGQRER